MITNAAGQDTPDPNSEKQKQFLEFCTKLRKNWSVTTGMFITYGGGGDDLVVGSLINFFEGRANHSI